MTTEDDFIKELLSEERYLFLDSNSYPIHTKLYIKYSSLKQKDLNKENEIKLFLVILSLFIKMGSYLDITYFLRFKRIPTMQHHNKKNVIQHMFRMHGITVIYLKQPNLNRESLYFYLDGGEIFHIRATSFIENPDILYKIYNVLKDTLDLKG